MKRAPLICGALVACLAAFAEDNQFPPEIGRLNALTRDETRLVEGVRQVDLLQQALISWDSDLLREAVESNNQEEAARRKQLIDQRRNLLEKAYKVLLAYYPKNARALNYYGEFLADQRGDMAGAVSRWKLAIAEDSKLSLPYNNLGIFYTHTGDYSLGLAALQKAIELEPDNPDFLFNLAQVYLINVPQVKAEYKWDDKRLYREAMKLSKKAAELKPDDYDLQQDYAVNFYAAQDRFGVKPDWKEAAKAWEAARGRATKLAEVFYTWLNEGRVWLRAEDYARAQHCIEEALKLYPASEPARNLLAKAKAGAQGPAEAPK